MNSSNVENLKLNFSGNYNLSIKSHQMLMRMVKACYLKNLKTFDLKKDGIKIDEKFFDIDEIKDVFLNQLDCLRLSF